MSALPGGESYPPLRVKALFPSVYGVQGWVLELLFRYDKNVEGGIRLIGDDTDNRASWNSAIHSLTLEFQLHRSG
jgi:hypothetical protein